MADAPQANPSTANQTLPLPQSNPPEDLVRTPDGEDPQVRLHPGARPLPDYELIQPLGRGAFGEVWKARGPGGFHVALKFIRLGSRAAAVEMRSLEIIKEQRHPHLLGLFGAWQRDDFLILAMELADRTLFDWLCEVEKSGSAGIPAEEMLECMREAAKGIDFLNSLAIQHRDIKPQNLLLVGGGVKVADFGLAKVLEQSVNSNSGAMTPAYAPPEFFNGQTCSQSDQYALAVSYCQLRGGRLPFLGNYGQIMSGHLLHEPDLTMLSEAERPVLARALAKNPADRWPSCRVFVEVLAAALGSGPGAAAPTPRITDTEALSPQAAVPKPAGPPLPTSGSGTAKPFPWRWLVLAALALLLVPLLIAAPAILRQLFPPPMHPGPFPPPMHPEPFPPPFHPRPPGGEAPIPPGGFLPQAPVEPPEGHSKIKPPEPMSRPRR